MTLTTHDRYAQVLDKASGDLTTAAIATMERELAWFSQMDAEHRSWISLIAHAGIGQCAQWLRTGTTPVDVTSSVFGAAPRDLARHVTLQQTVAMVKTTIEVIERHIDVLFDPDEAVEVRRQVSAYAREVAFATADVYARAAESRGQWDARMEALVVDAVVRGEPEEVIRSRAAALGWEGDGRVVVLVGAAPPVEAPGGDGVVEGVRRRARAAGLPALTSVQIERLVVVLGEVTDAAGAGTAVVGAFGDGAVVVGPAVPNIAQAHGSARAALAGLRAARGWPAAPRPVMADDLLVERALSGDGNARRTLVETVHTRVVAADPTLRTTLTTFFELGASVEATARRLFVHPNTVRYRLRKVREATGLDALQPRGAYTLHVGLTLGELLATTTDVTEARHAASQ
ncbi:MULTISPECIES: PucR family transcriptional regulator [Mumia]|uniref:PucR family transcriptional regulator n=1 Tax=Mumia xiangluensis TaxID=1678900 RepID=A0ABW1QLN5_9ACTN|nr:MULTISPECIES: helix-turn-helix domain-containing protein [Mumia]